MTTVDFEYAEVAAYSVHPNHNCWFVPCSCGKVHRHGAAEGPRVPHCGSEKNERYPNGYTLKYAGEASPELLRKIFGRSYRKELVEEMAWVERNRAFDERRRLKTESTSA